MESLNIYNNRMYAQYAKKKKGVVLAGVLCPQCQTELEETKPGVILSSLPPKKEVVCSSCGFRGYKIV